jgi:hypothetical protein
MVATMPCTHHDPEPQGNEAFGADWRTKMSGFLAAQETLTRERVNDIFRNKRYSYLEQKVTLLEVRDDSLLLNISFLIEYKNRMIVIEEKEPIVIPFADFKIEDWGDGVRKIADIE